MKHSRSLFKKALKRCNQKSDSLRANKIANALQADNSKKSFWQKIKLHSSKKSHVFPLSVNGTTGCSNIAEVWRQHYSALLNSGKSSHSPVNTIDSQINCSANFSDMKNYVCESDVISILLCKLPGKRSAGADGITSEHLKLSDSSICGYLSVLFNLCISHGYMPAKSINTIIVPLVKNCNADLSDTGNYRPIALSNVIPKLFEFFILHNIKSFLGTNCNQFGFKKAHSTSMSVFMLKQVISSYTSNNTPVFAAFLDASKAFDRVNHSKLFEKLIERGVPMCFVRLLRNWYGNQYMQVKWDGHLSKTFMVTNGVRQGSVLSPYFFFDLR